MAGATPTRDRSVARLWAASLEREAALSLSPAISSESPRVWQKPPGTLQRPGGSTLPSRASTLLTLRGSRNVLRMAKRYPKRHAQIRNAWAPRVAQGNVQCQEVHCRYSDRRILPHMAWDLAHTEDGHSYRGPAHASCNRAEGARRRQAQLGRRTKPQPPAVVDTVNQW